MTRDAEKSVSDRPLGGCPECGEMTGYRNIGCRHWGYCDAHKTAWPIGSNLFSGWRNEAEDDWQRNRVLLSGYSGSEPTREQFGDDRNNGHPRGPSQGDRLALDGCAVCNPELTPDPETARKAHGAHYRQVLHIAEMGDGFHVLEIPGPDGKPFRAWPGPFKSRLGASLFLDVLVDCAVEDDLNEACCSSGIFEHYDMAGRLLEWLGEEDPGNRALACRLASDQPWKERLRNEEFEGDGFVPF